MSISKDTVLFNDWEGYRVHRAYRQADKPSQVNLELQPKENHIPVCDGCGMQVSCIHDTVLRSIRDLPLFDSPTLLIVPRRRVFCPTCGPKLERLPWLDRHARMTCRFADYVMRLCVLMPIQHVAKWVGLHWDTVKQLDKRRLEKEHRQVCFKGITKLIMDEFALHKGHRYATVILNAENRQVLWVGIGNSRQSIRPFFKTLGQDGCRKIQAVAMDMNTAFDLEVRQHCPQARVVYDLFHVVAKYGREVIDRVRVDQANALKDDKPARRAVKRSRWLLLKNERNLVESQKEELKQLLDANQPLMTVYVLNESLKEIWRQQSAWQAWKCWRRWYRMANESDIGPLQIFARRLKPYVRGIISHSKYQLNTSILEGINNKIKVMKRMAYGYRDQDYFFLKIKAAFPGIP